MNRPDRHFTLHLFQRRNSGQTIMTFIRQYACLHGDAVERLVSVRPIAMSANGTLTKVDSCASETPMQTTRLPEVYSCLDR